jgi:short-subunit dehydrogenase
MTRTLQDEWRARYGPWAVVTGASDGIGREMARHLAEAGVHLVLVARGETRLSALAQQLRESHGTDTRVLAVDLAETAGVEALVEATDSLEVGLLAACAGFGTSGRFVDSSLARELELLDVNCRAVAALAHSFGRRFAAQGRGGLVLMSSIVAFQGVPFSAHYAATKAYVQSLAEGLHVELAPSGVDVVASAPGPVHSGFAARADMRMGQALAPRDVALETLEALGRRMTVRPGGLSKVLGYSLSTLPRRGRIWMMQKIMKGMTRHQGEPATEGGPRAEEA